MAYFISTRQIFMNYFYGFESKRGVKLGELFDYMSKVGSTILDKKESEKYINWAFNKEDVSSLIFEKDGFFENFLDYFYLKRIITQKDLQEVNNSLDLLVVESFAEVRNGLKNEYLTVEIELGGDDHEK